MGKAESSAWVEGPRERMREERMLAEQKRQADDEKRRRARERFELLRQADIRRRRQAAGLCEWCGQPLNVLLRMLRRRRHWRCRAFVE